MTYTHEPPACGPGHKAVAFTVMLACSALFVAMILWPVLAPFMTLEFAPAQAVGNALGSSLDGVLDEMLDRVR